MFLPDSREVAVSAPHPANPAHRNPAADTDSRRAALAERVERESGYAPVQASLDMWMRAAAHESRAQLAEWMNQTLREDRHRGARRVHYLSMEFLMGRALGNALSALGLDQAFESAAAAAGKAPGDILEREPDAALGNGGLGRLAACFLDSLATLGVPSFGYGLRYRYGIFAQRIHDGQQVEEADDWLRDGNPWELPRPELRYPVGFAGSVVTDGPGRRWLPSEQLFADAFDFIVPGHGTERVAVLRQWKARTTRPIDFGAVSRGDFAAAGGAKLAAEAINWVLYPDDSTHAGRELRLKQEYFLVSATLQDILAHHLADHGRLDNLADKVAIHLNDTHPALAVPEFIRLLVDLHGFSFDAAFAQCQRVMSYTNHTLMPEALETWPVRMLEHWLPRHLEIMFKINEACLKDVRARFPGDEDLVRQVSLFDENGDRRVKMAALSIVASHRVNGVSRLHSDLMVQTIFQPFARIFPDRFCNVTNGVTPRRWLAQANPSLSALLDTRLGPTWRTQLDRLGELKAMAGESGLRASVLAAKRANKERLAKLVRRDLGLAIDPQSLFDVQVKRIHEYKRQLLNALQVVARYQAIRSSTPNLAWQPRTVVFSGKAASAYAMAKTIIRLIHDIARTVNADPRVRDLLKVVYLPNYGVSLAEVIIPAADLSEQISTAGTEASGTGNMKMSMNGALTIGTWDGANVEICEEVGEENMFLFGLTAQEVARIRVDGYDPHPAIMGNDCLKKAVEMISSGYFSPDQPDRFQPIVDVLTRGDHYLLTADFPLYLAAQERVDALYRDPEEWNRRAILNVARMGKFSSDRTVAEYAREIWNVAVE